MLVGETPAFSPSSNVLQKAMLVGNHVTEQGGMTGYGQTRTRFICTTCCCVLPPRLLTGLGQVPEDHQSLWWPLWDSQMPFDGFVRATVPFLMISTHPGSRSQPWWSPRAHSSHAANQACGSEVGSGGYSIPCSLLPNSLETLLDSGGKARREMRGKGLSVAWTTQMESVLPGWGDAQ